MAFRDFENVRAVFSASEAMNRHPWNDYVLVLLEGDLLEDVAALENGVRATGKTVPLLGAIVVVLEAEPRLCVDVNDLHGQRLAGLVLQEFSSRMIGLFELAEKACQPGRGGHLFLKVDREGTPRPLLNLVRCRENRRLHSPCYAFSFAQRPLEDGPRPLPSLGMVLSFVVSVASFNPSRRFSMETILCSSFARLPPEGGLPLKTV